MVSQAKSGRRGTEFELQTCVDAQNVAGSRKCESRCYGLLSIGKHYRTF
jgi:hypothetical protein